MRYFGQFIPGAEAIVREILFQRLGEVPLPYLSGGAAEFETALPYSDLNLFCFHNLFQVLYSSSAEPNPAGLEKFLRSLPAAPADWDAARLHPAKCRSFRLVTAGRTVRRPASSGPWFGPTAVPGFSSGSPATGPMTNSCIRESFIPSWPI